MMTLLICLVTNTFAEDKNQAEETVSIWLKEVFKMKTYDDFKTRDLISKKLLKYSRIEDLEYVNKKIAQFWAIKNRVEKRDKNDMYNPQIDFSYSFKSKYIKYDEWRKKSLVWFTIFSYQNLDSGNMCNSIQLTKVNGKWKI